MIYREEIGKIYDTLFFCVKYFNAETIKDSITSHFADPSFMEECYHEVEQAVPTLPPILKPLFLYRNQALTVMTDFFTEYIDYQNDTFDTFLRKITAKSDVIYSKAISILFPSDSETTEGITPLISPAAYIETLNASEYPEDLKLQISLLFGNFNYVISLLVEQIVSIYQAIDKLHQKHKNKIIIISHHIESERNLQLYKKILSLNIAEKTDACYFSISLLNQYITYPKKSNEIICLLLGFKHEEYLNMLFDDQNINLRQLLVSIGNDTRLSILNALMEKNELTASDIAKMIKTPLTTVIRHIEILYESGVLFISKRGGLQIFYRINYNLLSKALKLLNNKIGEVNQ